LDEKECLPLRTQKWGSEVDKEERRRGIRFFLKEIIKKVWLIKKSINFALPKRREGKKWVIGD
jgi:hypothetical protein